MKYRKGFSHLLSDAPVNTVDVEPVPVTPPPPSYEPPKSSIIPRLIILGLIILIIYLIYTLIPRNFTECSRFPGSRISGVSPTTCRTFYGQSFNDSPSTKTDTINALLNTTPRPTYNPNSADLPSYPTIATDTPTTKGGLPLTSPTPTKKPAASNPKPVLNLTPIPTSAPGSTTIGNDWVKHRYPDQGLAFFLPKGWTGSDATRNKTTNITTFSLGGSSIQVRLEPTWNNLIDVKNNAINYEVKGLSAIKLGSPTVTTVYFERNSQVYIFSCHNSLWGTCHTILQNLEFI